MAGTEGWALFCTKYNRKEPALYFCLLAIISLYVFLLFPYFQVSLKLLIH